MNQHILQQFFLGYRITESYNYHNSYGNKYGNNIYNLSSNIRPYIGNNEDEEVAVGFFVPDGFYEFKNTWLGTGSVDKLKDLNWDSLDGFQGIWEYNDPMLLPNEKAHAVVWKVEVNGINNFDNPQNIYDYPIGVGEHEFKVYFNRQMDTQIDPLISYGVRQPFTQIRVEDGSWSSDGKIFTVKHDINIGADGINQINY